MAIRKLYSVCFVTHTGLGQLSDVVNGITVARSDEEVSAIVRKHVPPGKRFSIYMANTVGATKPAMASRDASLFLRFGFQWLDPQGPVKIGVDIPTHIARLISEGHAL